MKLTYILLLSVLANSAFASDFNSYMNEGIKFHDSGKFEQAEQAYLKALEIEPNNIYAQYELAFSYMVNQKNEECIATATKILGQESQLKTKIIIALGSCYSQASQTQKAISVFNDGLKQDPTDAVLHLNFAVTLANIQREKEAIMHLKRAIENSDNYASPYFYLAELYRTTNYKIPALFFYTKFILLEPNTRRSRVAAKHINIILFEGYEKSKSGGLTISLDKNAPKDEGDFLSIELLMPIAASEAKTEDNLLLLSEAEQFARALTKVIKIASELEDKNYMDSFTGKHAIEDVLFLQKYNVLKTYAFYIASKANMEGAEIWLNENDQKFKEMVAAIKAL